jgi:hypothetical protein
MAVVFDLPGSDASSSHGRPVGVRPRINPQFRLAALLVALLGAIFGVLIFASNHRGFTCSSDFMAFYAGGKLAFTGSLYSTAELKRIYSQELGCPHAQLLYIRPPLYASLVKPVTWLPYHASLAVWYSLNVASVAAFILVWPRSRLGALLACCWSFPLMSSFVYGQDSGIFLLLTGLLVRFAERPKHGLLRGILLVVGSCKIHIFLPALIPAIRNRPRRAMLGVVVAASLVLVASFVVGGPNWPVAWLQVAGSQKASEFDWTMINFRGLCSLVGVPPVLTVALTLPLCVVAVVGLARSRLDFAFAIAPAVGILLSGHSYLYDAALCIPFLLLSSERCAPKWLRGLAIVTLLPIDLVVPAIPPITTIAQVLTPLTTLAAATWCAVTSRTSQSFPERPSTMAGCQR